MCVNGCVCTLNRSCRLIDGPVAFHLSVGSEWRTPGDVDAPPCHFREGQVARLARSCRHMRWIEEIRNILSVFVWVKGTELSPLPTRLQCPSPTGVTGGSIASGVEGSQCDQIRWVTAQVCEVHTGVWNKNHLHLLRLVLLVFFPVVDLQHTQTQTSLMIHFLSSAAEDF